MTLTSPINVLKYFKSKDDILPEMKNRRREDGIAFAFCLLCAFIFIGICSRSSPIYPLNDWVDANCYFTVGKSMANGRVLYRDIYEQKGILLYVLHMIAYFISNTTFFGMYIIESLFFSAFLFLSYKTARMWLGISACLAFLPAISYFLLTSVSLRQGDSAEEMCLPFIMYAIYIMVSTAENEDSMPDASQCFILGACAACIFFIKFTLTGIYIGYIILAVIFAINDKKILPLLRSALFFALGAITVSIPFMVYFAVNGALSDFYTAYIYNNMFVYAKESKLIDKIISIFSLTARGIDYNDAWGILVLIGLGSSLLDLKRPKIALGTLILYVSNAFFIYYGGVGYYYYSLGMGALSTLGCIAVMRVLCYCLSAAKSALVFALGDNSLFDIRSLDKATKKAISIILIFATLLCVTLLYTEKSIARSSNYFYSKYEREDIWQEKFAKIINETGEEMTLLNYSCLDLGLYTTANILPSEKYFCRLNIKLPEMIDSLDRAVREKHTEFLVVRSQPSDFVLTYYEVIAKETSFLEFEGSRADYYLLKRK